MNTPTPPPFEYVSCGTSLQDHQEADSACCIDNSRSGEELDDFTCNSCEKIFTSKYALVLHVFTHIDGVNPPLHICKLCGEVFYTQCSLSRHSEMKDNQCGVVKIEPTLLDTTEEPLNCSFPQNSPYTEVKAESGQEPAPPTSDNGSFHHTDSDISQTGGSDHNSSKDRSEQPISKDSTFSTFKRMETAKGANVCHICNKSFRSSYCLEKHAVVHVVHTPYKCNDCGRSYAKLGSLRRHKLIMHKRKKLYKCNVCSKSFTDSSILKRHAVLHTRVKTYKCDECGKSFKEIAHLNWHSMTHTNEKPYVCHKCGKSFLQPASLKRHTRMHTRGGVDVLLPVCNICGRVFYSQRAFNMHLKLKNNMCAVAARRKKVGATKNPVHYTLLQRTPSPGDEVDGGQEPAPLKTDNGSFHQSDNDISQSDNDISQSDNDKSQSDNDIPQSDNETSQTLNDISQIERSNSNTQNDSSQQTISNDSALPSRKYSRTKKGTNVCDICNKSFRSLGCLKEHIVAHAVQTDYKCNDCGICFEHKEHLKKHAASHIVKKKRLTPRIVNKKHVCDECGKCFHAPAALKQHILSHTGEKPHVCACGKSYAKLYTLKQHDLVVHKGVRPYKCDVCLKTFTDKNVLRNHALVHTGERAFTCGDCGKAFKEAAHLKRHSVLHTGEKRHICAECGKAFAQRSTLKVHMRVHTGEKPYTCGLCSKSFADASNLRVHKRFHSGDARYKCDICERYFVLFRDLKKHTKVHIL